MAREFIVFKGKKFYFPYKCLCCGEVISKEQFCFGRLCAYCDVGRCHENFKYEKGHGRTDILDNAEEMGDELQEMVKEKLEIIKENSLANG